MRSLILIILCLVGLVPMQAQEHERVLSHANMLGVGRSMQYDTYLSPLEYHGPCVSFLHESMRMTHHAASRLSFQQHWQSGFAYTENPAGNAEAYGGHIAWNGGWHYHWTPLPRLRLMAGGLLGARVGFLYNTRNGNNPAQARCAMDLSASVAALYDLRIRCRLFRIRYQADLPVMGGMFSPRFGESYYEIGEGKWDDHVFLTHPGNALSLCQLLTVDCHFPRLTLRLGYQNDTRQSHVCHIRVRETSRNFLIGVVKHFSVITPSSPNASKTIL